MMKRSRYKLAGILGGMGPLATVELFRMIVDFTDAAGDAEHIPVIISSEPDVPDRTEAIIEGAESPLKHLIARAHMLEEAGVDFIGMPCITAHYYYLDILKEINVDFLNLLEITASFVGNLSKNYNNILVLSTAGALKTGVWKHAFKGVSSKNFIYPDEKKQEIVNGVIYGGEGVKGGNMENSMERLKDLLSSYKKKDVNTVVAGCTEIGTLLKEDVLGMKVINPLSLLAIEMIKLAGGKVKRSI